MASGVSAGIQRGLAQTLKTRRERTGQREREAAERTFQTQLAMLPVALEKAHASGDYSFVEQWLGEMDPALATKFKKEGSGFDVLGPILQQQFQLEQSQGAAEPRGSAAVESAPDAGAGPPAQVPQPGAAQAEGPTLFGMPFGVSREERLGRAKEAATEEQMITFDVRRRVAAQQGLDPASTEYQDFVRYGTRPPVATATATKGVLAGPGTLLLHPTTGEEIGRGLPVADTTKEKTYGPGTFDAQVARREAELDRKLTTTEVDALREEFLSEGGDAAEEADPAVAARARLAARQPQVMQQWTASGREDVLAAIEQDPKLYLQYEETRQIDARAMATKLERSLDALLDTSGASPRLSAGAKMLYGLSKAELGEQARGFFTAEGKEATASIKQLVGQEVLDQIAAMKAQSPTGATGFGQMNMAELDLLIASATVLQNWGLTRSNIGEERALTELIAIQDQLARMLEKSDVEVEQQQLLDEQQRRDATGLTGITMDEAGNIYQDGQLVIPGQ